ncbi:16449_t:CDS:2, partial [Racocetra fulgida]
MLVSNATKFHVWLIPQRWYRDTLVEDVSEFKNEVVITVTSNENVDVFENAMQVDFSHLESICGNHIFTKPINHKMMCRQQWGKGFGMLKKALNLAIMTNRSDELYEIHEELIKEMEMELENQEDNATKNNKFEELARTINNPISIRTKGRPGKRIRAFNDMANILNNKKGKHKVLRINQGQKSVSDTKEGGVSKRKCKNCELSSHNARTYPNIVECNNVETESVSDTPEASTSKRKCSNCGLK